MANDTNPDADCDAGDHALGWSDETLGFVCKRCGKSVQAISETASWERWG